MTSVYSPSPLLAQRKRFLQDSDNDEPFSERHACSSAKRARFQHSSPAGRCGGSPFAPSQAVAALVALFPGMDVKTVSTVLAECGDNIEAAIKRLGDLRLTAEEAAAANAAATEAAAAAAAAESEGSDLPSTSQNPEGPTTAEQWVDFLVGEMASARDMSDARGRAALVLQRFEAFVQRRVKLDEAKKVELAKENAILKKAVQIQNAKLQEKATVEAENQQLKQLLAQYQEQVRSLEVNNYSLTLHLQKATATSHLPSQRHPDVF